MWEVHGHLAHLTADRFSASVDLARPMNGLTDVRLAGVSLPSHALLRVLLPGHADAPIDQYVRGDDLIATYAQGKGRTVRPQLYWRLLDQELTAPGIGVELILSMETSRLDSRPATVVESVLPESSAAAASPREGRLALLRPAGFDWSFAQAAFPGDCQDADTSSTPAGEGRVRHSLFDSSLEKGVIRRARILGLFIPRAEESAVLEIDRRWRGSPLPLTT